jgi:exo-beta-1,3-glucanase (GH17 family)
MSKKICVAILVAFLVFSSFFVSNTSVSALVNGSTLPKYGVNCRISGDYPISISTVNDMRQGGNYWVRVSLTDPSAIPAVQNYMQNEDVLWCLPQYGWDVGQSWQQYVTMLTNSASSNVKAWEIGNEPEQSWWGGTITPQQYVTELQQAYTIIKAKDPTALIIGPAVATSASGLNFLSSIKSLGAFNYLDAISVHYYPTLGASNIQSIENVVGSKPIWITETGFTTYGSSESLQNSFYQTNYNPISGLIGKDPKIQVIIIYELNDYSYPTESGDGFGLTYGPYSNYLHKQAYTTFKSYLTLNATTSTPTPQLTIIPTNASIHNPALTTTPKPAQASTNYFTNLILVSGIITFSSLIAILFFICINRKKRRFKRIKQKRGF